VGGRRGAEVFMRRVPTFGLVVPMANLPSKQAVESQVRRDVHCGCRCRPRTARLRLRSAFGDANPHTAGVPHALSC
jgi:hypothetical protein